MGWVPAYGIDASMKALTATPGIGQAMTRLGLQFWNPSVDGKGLVLAPVDATGRPVTAAYVRQLQRWARSHNVQPLLTVYNNSQVINRWDWSLARRAFAEHPDEFSAALVAAVDKWDLDGVDLDLEGEGDFGADRAAYAAFVHQLAAALKAKGKILTVDSFHSPCDNAPNMRWWSDWAGDVATIHSMGYEDLYEGSKATFTPEGKPVCEGGATLFRYSWQLEWGMKAGYRRDQIVMGMPTWVDAWGSGGMGPAWSTTCAKCARWAAAWACGTCSLPLPAGRSPPPGRPCRPAPTRQCAGASRAAGHRRDGARTARPRPRCRRSQHTPRPLQVLARAPEATHHDKRPRAAVVVLSAGISDGRRRGVVVVMTAIMVVLGPGS
jgi:hypothetical protein